MMRAQSFLAKHRETTPGSVPTRRQVLVFHLAGQAYALPLEEVQEIVPMAELSRPPGMPSALAGFLNLGGCAVPVLRLDRLFGLREQDIGLYTPLLVLRQVENRVALMVERVSDLRTLPAEAILPVPPDHSFNDCAEGIVLVEGPGNSYHACADRVVVVLSAGRILLEKEQQHLAELQDREQARLRELEESLS
jgi:purine-binding chemotaxis protein CheW